jgi:WD40 repeat protein
MAEIAQAADTPTPGVGPPMEYDAFLSYAHHDKQVTTAIQKGLHRIGRRFGQLRALRVFRDDTNLEATPDLWGRIVNGLDRSRFMIVVLSPRSAASYWVNAEVTYWLQRRGPEHLILVLAAGHLHWDATPARFDPGLSDAALPVLTQPGSLSVEPLYIDVSADAPWDIRSLAFRDKVTALAASIHGKPKDQLASDDLREQRRFRRLRVAAISGLALLTVIAIVAAVIAVGQRQEAIQRLRDAVVAKLYAEGNAMLAGTTPGNDGRALQKLLAANAIADAPDGVPILNAQIARFTTEKIIPAPGPRGLAYSPDGQRVVTTHLDGELGQWDCVTGKLIGAPIKGPAGLAAVAYTPDGKTIASAGKDGTMRLWDASTGAPLNPDPVPVAELDSIAVSPDGKAIFTGGAHGTIQVWDPHSGQLLATPFSGTVGPAVSSLAIDPSGRLLAGGAFDAAHNWKTGIVIIDIATNKPHAVIVPKSPDGRTGAVYQIAFSPDGHTLAVAGDDLQLWNVDTDSRIRTIPAGADTETDLVTAVAFSPDGHRIAIGRSDGKVRLLDADTGAQVGETLIGHTRTVFGLAFSPDGGQIATSSADETLRFWSAIVGQPMRGPDPNLLDVAFSPDGHRMAASGDTAVQQWDVSSGRPLAPLMVGGAGGHWFAYVDGGRIVTAAGDGTVQVWDANTGQPLQPPVHLNLPVTDDGMIYAFSGDGHTIAWGHQHDTTVTLWDVATGRALGQPMTINAPDEILGGLAFSPDGKHLAAGYSDGLRLWNVDTTQPEGSVITDSLLAPVSRVAFNREGTIVAAASSAGSVEVWDPKAHKKLLDSPLQGHNSYVLSIAFGIAHQLATGGADATLRLWDTSTGNATAAPEKVSAAVMGVAISPDGRLAAEASYDGTMRLSPAITDPSQLCAKLVTNMSRKQWRDWVSPGIGYITLCPGLPIAPD